MPATISDIAKKLNISPSAVSKILNKKGNFSKSLIKKVHETAKEMHYIPNNIAKNLQHQSNSIIGIVIPDISEIFFSGVVNSIEHHLYQNGYQIFLCNSQEDVKKEINCVKQLYANRVSGIILATVREEIDSDDLLFNGDIPVVFFDNVPKTEKTISSVSTDNYGIGTHAATELIKHNHKKIAAIMGKQSESGAYERYIGFTDVLKENNLPFKGRFCDFKEESAYYAAKELLAEDDYSAFFVASSKMLHGATKAFREAGKKIPEDISVIGVDVEDHYNTLYYPVTSILQSEEHMGKLCADLLLKQIKQDESPQTYRIPFSTTQKHSVKQL